MLDFIDLGISPVLSRICKSVGLKKPTKIQALTIPYILKERDLIGFSQTGSGKTLAFILPILNRNIVKRNRIISLILAPSRELVLQIAGQGDLVGGIFGFKIATLIGGIDSLLQTQILNNKPHLIVSTPGRLIEHIKSVNTNVFEKIKILVLDEADRLLQTDFEKELNILISEISLDKQNLLFSASTISHTANLERLKLKNPVKIFLNKENKISGTLIQNYLYMPFKWKESYLIFLCNEYFGSSIVVFASTKNGVEKLALILRLLGFHSTFIHGEILQSKRLKIINKFKASKNKILITTDLASRGLDFHKIDIVINYDLPFYVRTYLHRVGRTARGGKSGKAISLVSQYDIRSFQKIEKSLCLKISEYPHNPEKVTNLLSLTSRTIEKVKNLKKKGKDVIERLKF